MAYKAQPLTTSFVVWNNAAASGQTGAVANLTLRWVKDGVAIVPTNACEEIDPVILPGLYRITLTAAETACWLGTLGGKHSLATVVVVPVTISFDEIDQIKVQTDRFAEIAPGPLDPIAAPPSITQVTAYAYCFDKYGALEANVPCDVRTTRVTGTGGFQSGEIAHGVSGNGTTTGSLGRVEIFVPAGTEVYHEVRREGGPWIPFGGSINTIHMPGLVGIK
jgi:hypothetical protein